MDEKVSVRDQVERMIQHYDLRFSAQVQMVEHAYERNLLHHELDMQVFPERAACRFVVLHPEACGCDCLTDELVLHG